MPLQRRLKVLNLARTALNTAYGSWAPGESYDDFMARLERCLQAAAPHPQ